VVGFELYAVTQKPDKRSVTNVCHLTPIGRRCHGKRDALGPVRSKGDSNRWSPVKRVACFDRSDRSEGPLTIDKNIPITGAHQARNR